MKERQKALEKMQVGRGESDNGPKKGRRVDKRLVKLDEEAGKVEAKVAKEMKKAVRENPNRHDKKWTELRRSAKRNWQGYKGSMGKWPEMPAKSPRRMTSTVKKIIRRPRRARSFMDNASTLIRLELMKQKRGEMLAPLSG